MRGLIFLFSIFVAFPAHADLGEQSAKLYFGNMSAWHRSTTVVRSAAVWVFVNKFLPQASERDRAGMTAQIVICMNQIGKREPGETAADNDKFRSQIEVSGAITNCVRAMAAGLGR